MIAAGHDADALPQYTARQIRLYYRAAEKRRLLDKADQLDMLSLSFTGKTSPAAARLRKEAVHE